MVADIVSIAVLAAYCLIVYEFRAQAAGCLKNAVLLKLEDAAGNDNKLTYNRFLNAAIGLGVVATGIMAARLTIPAEGLWRPEWLAAVAPAAAVCILAFQFGIIRAAGRLTLSEEMADGIVRSKKRYMAAATMLIVPFVVTISSGGSDVGTDFTEWPARNDMISYIIVTEAVIAAAMSAVQSLLLFMRQKVSLLVWFLYLCGIEILPVSLIVLIGVKNF